MTRNTRSALQGGLLGTALLILAAPVILAGSGYAPAQGSGNGLSNLVEDTTPELGGDLDGQSTYDLNNMVDGEFEGKILINGTTLKEFSDGYLQIPTIGGYSGLTIGDADGSNVILDYEGADGEVYVYGSVGTEAGIAFYGDPALDTVHLTHGGVADTLHLGATKGATNGTLSLGVLKANSGYADVAEIATPANPSAGYGRFYVDSNGVPLFVSDDGNAYDLRPDGNDGGVGGGTPWAAWTALDGIAPVGTTTDAAFAARNGHRVLAFDDTTDESVDFEGTMHTDYAGGTLTVTLVWMAQAIEGDAQWAVAWERGSTDLDSDSFASEQSTTATTNATGGIPTSTTITFTQAQADGIAAGEPFRLRVIRDSPGNPDTLTGDVELLRVTVEE